MIEIVFENCNIQVYNGSQQWKNGILYIVCVLLYYRNY